MTTPTPAEPGWDPPARSDPSPEESTGLEAGGGVPPGETPPGEASVSAVPVDSGSGKRTRSPWFIILLIALPVLLVSLLLLVEAFLRA